MKKLIIIFFFFSIHSNSQTLTEKWNSLYERYEYFDSNNTLVGYKKYNSLYGRWEYYDLKKESNNNNGNNLQARSALPDLNVLDQALTERQRRYDLNKSKISYLLDDIFNQINKMISDRYNPGNIDVGFQINHRFIKEYVNVYNEKKYDLSSNNLTEQVYNWLKNGYNKIYNEEFKKYNSIQKTKETYKLKFSGEYLVKKVFEQKWDNNRWIDVKYEYNNAGVYFGEGFINFWRGDNIKSGRALVFENYDAENSIFNFSSEHGDVLIDEKLNQIIFYDISNSNIRYIYVMNDNQPNVKIEKFDDKKEIININKKKFENAITTNSGLKYIVLKKGIGRRPYLNSNVKIRIKCKNIEGFDLTDYDKLKYGSNNTISDLTKGLQECLQMMNEGSIYKFYCPCNLAYNENCYNEDKVPKNTDLIFEIELIKINY